jgi:hypothetical protein
MELDVLYCALCETEMPFEHIEVGPCEFVCVTCGAAIFLDPPCQAEERLGQRRPTTA